MSFNIVARKDKESSLDDAKRKDNTVWFMMVLPLIIWYIVFQILPMYGMIVPFKDFKYNLGILGSPWVGFKNFEYFFTSPDFAILMRNSIGYHLLFLFVNNITNILIAFALYEVRNKTALKFYQTVNTLPSFMSWIVVSYVVYALLSPAHGYFAEVFGTEMNWYTESKYWPFILTFIQDWKQLGTGCILYYAALMGIDGSLFDAADIDGASNWQKRWYICVPAMKAIFGMQIILGIGSALSTDFGLFYQVPLDVSALYPTTDTIDTYVFRGLRTGDMAVSSAIGLFKSLVGAVLVVVSNAIVKKVDPDSRLF